MESAVTGCLTIPLRIGFPQRVAPITSGRPTFTETGRTSDRRGLRCGSSIIEGHPSACGRHLYRFRPVLVLDEDHGRASRSLTVIGAGADVASLPSTSRQAPAAPSSAITAPMTIATRNPVTNDASM